MNRNDNDANTKKSPLVGGDLGVVKAIIFDLDGTILDSVADIASANNQVLTKHGLQTHDVEAYIGFIGNGARRLVQLALPAQFAEKEDVVDRFLEEYKLAYKANIVDKSTLFEGILELLKWLNEVNIPIAINTNKPHDQTMLIAGKLLQAYDFAAILGQKDENPKKPDPFGASWIASQLGLKPGEVLFVGDSAVDVKTAQNAGMQLVGVSWGYSKENEFADAGCETIVDTASELRTLIEARIKILPMK